MKRNPKFPIAVILLAGLLTGSVAGLATMAPAASPAAAVAQTAAAQAGQAQLATINTYCVGCHNDRAKTGGITFEGLKAEGIAEHADVF